MRDKITADIRASIAAKESLLADDIVTRVEQAVSMIVEALRAEKKILFFGNGGSASDSQHLAAEFIGRYEKERRALASIALTTDTSILTAVANDYSFDRIFERQIEGLGRPGDIAVGISTSGNSKNVLLGVRKARQMGLKTIGLLGRDGGEIAASVDLPIVIPSKKTARIQECHILIGHIICERVDEVL